MQEELSGEIADIADILGFPSTADTEATGIFAILEQLEAQGLSRGEAIAQLATELNTSVENLTGLITGVESNVLGQLGEVKTELTTDIQAIADILGKPYTDVTQGDVDVVNQIIQDLQTDPNTQLTQQQLAYDINQDGQIDVNDQTMLNQIISGEISMPTNIPTGTVWDRPTGLFLTMQEERDRQIAAEEAAREQLKTTGKTLAKQQLASDVMRGLQQATPEIGKFEEVP